MAEWFWKRNYNKRTEKDYGLIRTIYYKLFVYFVVWPVSKLFYSLKVEGRENVPKGRNKEGRANLIIAGNHVSYLDPPMITYAVQRRVAYMGKKELFTSPHLLLRAMCISLGGFAVNREKPELATFRTVKAIFNTPWLLGIFPQGGIRHEPVLDNIHKGFTMFAKKFEADVLPVAVCGFDGYSKWFFQKHMTIKIGKPISYKLSDEEIVQEWARQICEMTGFENKIDEPEKEEVTIS